MIRTGGGELGVAQYTAEGGGRVRACEPEWGWVRVVCSVWVGVAERWRRPIFIFILPPSRLPIPHTHIMDRRYYYYQYSILRAYRIFAGQQEPEPRPLRWPCACAPLYAFDIRLDRRRGRRRRRPRHDDAYIAHRSRSCHTPHIWHTGSTAP